MRQEEWFNSTSHLVGLVLAMVGVIVLLAKVAETDDILKTASFTIYGATLFVLYLSSTLYHSARGHQKARLRIFDYQAVYLLIAGTYTPFSLVTLRGTVGWWLFGITWGIALIGIVMEALHQGGKRILPVIIYLAMGWIGLFVLDPLLNSLSPEGFRLLLTGGVLYSAGVIFFTLDHWYHWAHGIWHLFVLAGSVCHYFAILFYV